MKRTPEEIGAAFERDIGQRYESQGWVVWYRGIARGKGDLGIDLVATKGARQMLIQCKCWTWQESIPHVEIERFAEACRKYVARRGGNDAAFLPGVAAPRSYGMAYITTARFSRPAQLAALRHGVILRAGMPMAAAIDGPRVEFATPISARARFALLPEATPFTV